MRRVIGGVLVMALCAAAAVQARVVYRWVDADGAEHFSDTPREGAVEHWLPDGPRSGAARGVGTAPSRAPQVPSRAAAADEAPALDEDTAQELAQACKGKKTRLRELLDAQRVVETDSLGRERVYTDTERRELIQRTQDDIKLVCRK